MSFLVLEKYINWLTNTQCTSSMQENCRKFNTGPISEIIVCMFQVHEKHLTYTVGFEVRNTELIL